MTIPHRFMHIDSLPEDVSDMPDDEIANTIGKAEKELFAERKVQVDLLDIHTPVSATSTSPSLLERNTRESLLSAPGGSKKDPNLSRFLREDMTVTCETVSEVDSVSKLCCQQATRNFKVTSIGPWQLVRTIGQGATSKVKLAVNTRTGEQRAVKMISRKKFREQVEGSKSKSRESVEAKEKRVIREATLLYVLDHKNILPLLDFHVTSSHFIMFFEYIEGVRMLDFIQSHKLLPEKMARKFFKQILSAVDFLHERSIVHRDLKIENVMVEDPSGHLRLIDFGLSNFYDSGNPLTTYCGSLYFAAPELLHGKPYEGPEIDVWSLGVILYVMVTGQVPFDDQNVQKLHEKIKSGQVQYPDHISKQCRGLLERMLVVDPTRRASVTELFGHPWVTASGPLDYCPPLKPLVLDERVIEHECSLFNYEFPRQKILNTLNAGIKDWYRYRKHPVVAVYRMLQEKMGESDALVSGCGSKSLNDLKAGDCDKMDDRVMAASMNTLDEHEGAHKNEQLRHSENPPGPSTSPLATKEMYPLAHPSIRSLISAPATSFKPTYVLRASLISALQKHYKFSDHLTYFTVEWTHPNPEQLDGVFDERRSVKLEVHLVQINGVGVHLVQFRRVCGELTVYKAICADILNNINL